VRVSGVFPPARIGRIRGRETPPEEEGWPMRRALIRSLGIATAFLLLSQGMMVRAQENKKEESEPFKRLTVEEVGKRLNDPGVHVYDGNTDELYLNGHLPGAVHLFSKDIKEGVLPADKGTSLIFYCHNER
jgi:hypothetical protein